VRGPFLDLDRAEVLKTLIVTAYGGFLVRKQRSGAWSSAARRAFLTGASASVKGYAESAPFAMGKFALRGLAQSLAREFARRTSMSALRHRRRHRARRRRCGAAARGQDGMLRPDAIAETYLRCIGSIARLGVRGGFATLVEKF